MLIEDSAIIILLKKFQEHDLLVTCFTKEHGVIRGLYKQNRKECKLGIGCTAHVKWNARLAEHLGTWKIEILSNPFIHTMHDVIKHKVLLSIMELLNSCLKEREVNLAIYEETLRMLKALENSTNILKDYVFFEHTLLHHIGYGLDLSKCVATNSCDDLKYISPKSGKAVSATAGKPYDSKLFKLPAFLNNHSLNPSLSDVKDALKISRYFLEKSLPLTKLELLKI